MGDGSTPGKLFLMGGDTSVFELIADAFVAEARGAEARLAILLIGGEGWERHRPGHAGPWERRGVQDIAFVVPDRDGLLATEHAVARVSDATGIIVGGGNTEEPQRLYANEPMRTAIRQQVSRGAPYAGLSAGALLAPEVCVLRPYDDQTEPRFMPGLGLLPGPAIGVHYNRPGQPELLQAAMAHTGVHEGLGIDEGACAVVADGKLSGVLGHGVSRVISGEDDPPRGGDSTR